MAALPTTRSASTDRCASPRLPRLTWYLSRTKRSQCRALANPRSDPCPRRYRTRSMTRSEYGWAIYRLPLSAFSRRVRAGVHRLDRGIDALEVRIGLGSRIRFDEDSAEDFYKLRVIVHAESGWTSMPLRCHCSR